MDKWSNILAYASLDFKYPARIMSQWFETKELDVYMRNTLYSVGGSLKRCIVVANINVHDKGKGTFTKLINDLIAASNDAVEFIVVENVMNDRLANYLAKAEFSGLKFKASGELIGMSYALDIRQRKEV